MGTHQTELPIRVAVCAWCEPEVRGTILGEVSHGICPRHLKKLTQSLPTMSAGKGVEITSSGARRSRRLKKPGEDVAQMSFEAMVFLDPEDSRASA